MLNKDVDDGKIWRASDGWLVAALAAGAVELTGLEMAALAVAVSGTTVVGASMGFALSELTNSATCSAISSVK